MRASARCWRSPEHTNGTNRADGDAVQSRTKFPELDNDVLAYWAEDGTFEASVNARPVRPALRPSARRLREGRRPALHDDEGQLQGVDDAVNACRTTSSSVRHSERRREAPASRNRESSQQNPSSRKSPRELSESPEVLARSRVVGTRYVPLFNFFYGKRS
jgi:hypothetical protein